MGSTQKNLLTIVLVAVIALIIFTWGSIGSAALTLGLLLAGIFLLLRKSIIDRDSGDYWTGVDD
jgi:hypothetical protein